MKKMAFQKILLCSFCFVFINNVAALTSSAEDKWFLIKNKALETYLDASTGEVALQDFQEGSETQLWQLRQSGNPGLFYIVNKSTGRSLFPDTHPALHRVYASGPIDDGRFDSQWFVNYDGTVANADNQSGGFWFLDVYGPGNLLVVFAKNGNATQQFELELAA